MSNVPYMCFFGKERTRALDALPARLGRAAGPGLARARSAAAVVVLRRRTVVVRLTRCTLRIQELLQRALAELLAPISEDGRPLVTVQLGGAGPVRSTQRARAAARLSCVSVSGAARADANNVSQARRRICAIRDDPFCKMQA